jgi:hypothetical protein
MPMCTPQMSAIWTGSPGAPASRHPARERDWQHVRVRRVVGERADPRARHVAHRRKVGRKHKGEQRPERIVAVDVESERRYADGQALGTQQESRHAQPHGVGF